MEYSSILQRSWQIIWNNKWLIFLGVLIGLGSGGGSNFNFRNGFNAPTSGGNSSTGARNFPDVSDFNPQNIERALGIGIPIIIAILCVVVLIAITLVILARIAS